MVADFFTKNLDVVFMVYGLSFVVMGVAILAQPRRESVFKLADVIWILAGFGLTHGLNEWLDMFSLIAINKYLHGAYVLGLVRLAVLSVSYVFLFEFGRRLISFRLKGLLDKWVITAFLCFVVLALMIFIKQERSVWPRYFLGFPGGAFAALGLIWYYYDNETILKPIRARLYFITAAVSLCIYGVLGGVVVPKTDFFPASIINTDSFLKLFGIPVQVFRAICAIVLAWAVCKVLNIFNWEIRDKLKKSLEVVGTIASGVAHEVKNPLAIILQSIEYISKKVKGSDENVSLMIEDIKEAVERADKIIRGLLDFSGASKVNMDFENLNSVIDGSLRLIKSQLLQAHIEVIKNLEKDIPPIKMDKNKIEQALIDLFINAMHAMPNGGKLTVKTFYKELETQEKVVIVQIEDTGHGIPEDVLGKIFDPFFTTRRRQGGTGLGLSIVRNIVEQHNGKIEIQNKKEGRGVIAEVIFKGC
jgi:signal transduction histidine kinase